jgi:hypothetical protein
MSGIPRGGGKAKANGFQIFHGFLAEKGMQLFSFWELVFSGYAMKKGDLMSLYGQLTSEVVAVLLHASDYKGSDAIRYD